MSKSVNAFDKFKPEQGTHFIESLGAEVTLRPLTLGEQDDIQLSMIASVDENGKPEMKVEALTEIKYTKVSLALVKPSMSVKSLKALGPDASKAIVEILKIIDPEVVDNEGNSAPATS